MSSPQLENGYTAIANEILEQLALCPLNSGEFRVIWVILRKTYGWQKKEDRLSIDQIAKNINMSRRWVIYTLKNLEAKNMVVVKRSRMNGDGLSSVNIVSFQKNYSKWVVQRNSEEYEKELEIKRKRYQEKKNKVVQRKIGSAENRQKVVQRTVKDVSFSAPTKETITKETKETTKKGGKPPLKKEVVFNPLGEEIIEAFIGVDPKNKLYYGNTTQRGACDFLLREYGLEETLKRVSVLSKTNKIAYFPTINTPAQLRDKWVQLQDAVDRKRGEIKNKKKVAFS